MKILGLILIAIGLGALLYQWSYKDTLANRDANSLPKIGWPMYVGALSMAGGTFILLGKKKGNL